MGRACLKEVGEVRGPSTGKDRADWLVQPDWEAKNRIINDIMHVEEEIDREVETQARMQECFGDDPWLREVVDALTDGELGDIHSQLDTAPSTSQSRTASSGAYGQKLKTRQHEPNA